MLKEIEIIEGHNKYDYFWFRPVMFEINKVCEPSVILLHDELSISEENVSSFLLVFFKKYYDNSLWCNKAIEVEHEQHNEFVYYFTYNFFRYEVINDMCDEILEVANLLETDYENPILAPIKKHFSFCLQCKSSCKFADEGKCVLTIGESVKVVTHFYRRFVHLIREIMRKNPQTVIMSIMGP